MANFTLEMITLLQTMLTTVVPANYWNFILKFLIFPTFPIINVYPVEYVTLFICYIVEHLTNCRFNELEWIHQKFN